MPAVRKHRWIAAFVVAAGLLIGPTVLREVRSRWLPSDPAARLETLRQLAENGNGRAWASYAGALDEFAPGAIAEGAHKKAAELYALDGKPSFAYKHAALAQRYELDVRLYQHQPTTAETVTAFDSRARLEPPYGCYLGAFNCNETHIAETYQDESGSWRRDVSTFNRKAGVEHGMFFMYQAYGKPFPNRWIEHLKSHRAAAQLAWEPSDLMAVQDDAYLRGFAREAAKSGWPIFLRFASEMNGDWTPYHGDPALYREKFRLLARVMHEEAPNVAMVWCPFEIPVRWIEPYFPGHDAVDWVGVNIYSVPFYDNDASRRADWRNPADQLRHVYALYSDRHPILVCEYAASHRSSLDGAQRSEFAVTKTAQMYASLPRLYPRVKGVCWLSMNAIATAIPGRQKNDYSLLNDEAKREKYVELASSPYYLKRTDPSRPPVAPWSVHPLLNGATANERVFLSAWVKVPVERPRVEWHVNGRLAKTYSVPGTYPLSIAPSSLRRGTNQIELQVFDGEGRLLATESKTIVRAES